MFENMPELDVAYYDDALSVLDHWIMHERDPGGMMTALHTYYVNRKADIVRNSGAKTVLDVGCGDGWTTSRPVAAGLDAVGIDWSRNATTYASVRVPRGKFFPLDVRDAQLSEMFPKKFDAAIFIEVIEHIPPNDCVAAISNIAARLKSGATFVLTTFNKFQEYKSSALSAFHRGQNTPDHFRRWRPDRCWRRRLRQHAD